VELRQSSKWPDKLVMVKLVPGKNGKTRNQQLEKILRLSEQYLNGKQVELPLDALDLSGLSGFARQTLETLRQQVPRGKVITYGRLAELCGHPGAARTVGSVMRNNPFPLFFPCHRVVRSDLRCGGFMGVNNSSGETELKRQLLIFEGVMFESNGKIANSCQI